MGLLDSVIGSVLGGGGGPLQGVLGQILGGQGGGGLGALVQQFEQAGLGGVVQSWISNQQSNQPVSPDALQQVFGNGQVQQWSQQAGMDQHSLLQSLSQLLPHAVDQATPNGRVEATGFDAAGTTG